jgi:tetratricopeptide (TPR) repeat protein
VDPEPSPSRSSFKSLLADSYSQTLSEQWLKGAWDFVREKAHHHFVAHPLIGEMGQSALLIVSALFLLSSAAGILGGRYWVTRANLAHEEFERARGLNAQGQHDDALRHLRVAFHLEHHNREYQMALILTLIELERFDEARLQLDDILKADPTNAPANLLLARIAASDPALQMDTAVQYYQRAIYGLWPSEPVRNRIDTRFELANMLAGEGRVEELRAELIVLAADVRDDVAQLLQVGYLMLFAKSPGQAETVFLRAIGQAPRNAEALAGLGRAQLETGNFPGSEQAFLRAARYNPENAEIRRQLAVVQSIRAMNPKRRGLGIYLAADRARGLVSRTHQRIEVCAEEASLPADAVADLEAAATRLNERRRGAPTMESVDADIALAIRLYHHGSDFCPNPDRDEALERLVLALSNEQ